MTLRWLDGISVDPNRQGTVDRVDRNYQTGISVPSHEYTLHPIQGPAANSDALPDFQEWTGSVWNHTFHKSTDVLNFYFRDWNRSATKPYETQDSICAYDLCANFRHPRKVDECVARKKWKFHTLASVTPPAYLGESRQESGNAQVLQSHRHNFLVTGARVNGIPTGRAHAREGVWCHFLASMTAAHSFALSVTGRLISDPAKSPYN